MTTTNSRYLYPICMILTFVLGFELGAFQLSTLSLSHEFNIGNSIAGLIITAQYIAIVIGLFVMRGVSDYFGKKKVLAVFIPVFALGCYISGSSNSILTFVLGVFVIGIAFSTVGMLVGEVLADTNPSKSEKQIVMTQFSFSMGAFTGSLLLDEMMIRGYDWRTGFVLCAIAFIALLPPLLVTKITYIPGVEFADAQEPKPSLLMFLKPNFLVLFFSAMAYGAVITGAMFFANSALAIGLNVPENGSLSISLFWFAVAVTRFFYKDKKGDAKKAMSRSQFFIFATMVIIIVSTNHIVTLIMFALAGLSFGLAWPLFLSLGAQEFPDSSEKVAELLLIAAGIGGAVFITFFGIISDVAGVKGVYVACALLSLVVYVTFRIFNPPEKKAKSVPVAMPKEKRKKD